MWADVGFALCAVIGRNDRYRLTKMYYLIVVLGLIQVDRSCIAALFRLALLFWYLEVCKYINIRLRFAKAGRPHILKLYFIWWIFVVRMYMCNLIYEVWFLSFFATIVTYCQLRSYPTKLEFLILSGRLVTSSAITGIISSDPYLVVRRSVANATFALGGAYLSRSLGDDATRSSA